MYDGPPYDHSSLEGNPSQPGRPKMPNNYYTNENYPNPAYGQMSQPQTAPGPGRPYYSSDMQPDRRPLQPIDNPSLIGQVAQRHQQNVVRTYHGYSQPQMCQPLERQPSGEAAYGRALGHSEPMDVGYQHQQHGAGYLGGSQGYSMEYSQGPQQPRAPYGGAAGAGAGQRGQHHGYAPQEGRTGMYCDPTLPAPLYSNFTPMYTSSPNTSPLAKKRMLESHNPVRVEPMLVAEHQRAHETHQSAYQQPPAGPGQWVRPTGLVTFERTQPAIPVPVQVPRPPKQPANRILEESTDSAASSGTRSSTPVPSPRESRPWPTPGPAGGASSGSFSIVSSPASPSPSAASSSGSERGGPGARRQAAPAPDRGIRVLTGTVDNILTWGKKLDEESRPEILFEIVGNLDSVMRGQWHSSRLVCLRSLQTSNTLTAVFWEIDRPLFPPPIGSVVA